MTVIYEDNHIIVINKTASEIVQGDKTGDTPLSETVKQYIKEKYAKPGNVFIGVTHRLDRPVSGLVILAKTSKALSRLNEMFKNSEVKKTYWAIVKEIPKEPEGELVHFLVRNEKQNKSYAYDRLSDQRRSEIWFSPFQSGWQYLSACTSCAFHSSGIQRSDRIGCTCSDRKFVERVRDILKQSITKKPSLE